MIIKWLNHGLFKCMSQGSFANIVYFKVAHFSINCIDFLLSMYYVLEQNLNISVIT